jgi:hypothetical protein
MSFLRGLYKSLLSSREVYGYAADAGDQVLGVIVVGKNVAGLMRRQLMRHPFFFVFHLLKFAIFHPNLVKQVVSYSRFGKDVPASHHEILLFGVAESLTGAGSMLLCRLVQGTQDVLTVTTTLGNSKAIHVYRKHDFQTDRMVSIHKMECIRLIRFPHLAAESNSIGD